MNYNSKCSVSKINISDVFIVVLLHCRVECHWHKRYTEWNMTVKTM